MFRVGGAAFRVCLPMSRVQQKPLGKASAQGPQPERLLKGDTWDSSAEVSKNMAGQWFSTLDCYPSRDPYALAKSQVWWKGGVSMWTKATVSTHNQA